MIWVFFIILFLFIATVLRVIAIVLAFARYLAVVVVVAAVVAAAAAVVVVV